MRKRIILVSGVSNSGKTSSIRKYLTLEEIFHLRGTGDITLMFPLRRKRLSIGVASGGDSPAIIERNFKFFSKRPWDVIVCASKSYGATIDAVSAQAKRADAQLIVVQTEKLPGSRQAAEHARVAEEIWQAI